LNNPTAEPQPAPHRRCTDKKWPPAKINRLAVSAAVAIVLAASFVASPGCQPAPPTSAETQDPATGDVQPLVITDRLNRQVTLATRPVRIVSLSPETTELLFAIGAGQKIVGATEYCDYPKAANAIPRVGGGAVDSISREAILGVEPDLVLCRWDAHEPLVELFERLHIPILAIGPNSLSELFEETELLGKVTGHTTQAAALIKTMKGRHRQLLQRVSAVQAKQRPTVFYEVWDDPLMTAGPGSFIGESLRTAGLKNIFDDTTKHFPQVSNEVVVARNPQVILAPSDHADKVTFHALAGRPGWSAIRAVKNRRVYLIDGDKISRCGPRLLESLEEIIELVHGDPASGDRP